MQVRAALPARALTPVAPVRPVATPAAAAAVKPAPQGNVKAQNADASFGSDIFQSAVYGLTNLGQIVALPAFLGGLVRALPLPALAAFNIGMGAFQVYKDVRGWKAESNRQKWDDYVRLGSSAAIIAGGGLLLAGAVLSPALPLIGAGLAAGGFVARIVGIWNDDARI